MPIFIICDVFNVFFFFFFQSVTLCLDTSFDCIIRLWKISPQDSADHPSQFSSEDSRWEQSSGQVTSYDFLSNSSFLM